MIPESGTHEQFKSVVLENCTAFPVPGEVYRIKLKAGLDMVPMMTLLLLDHTWGVVNVTENNVLIDCMGRVGLQRWRKRINVNDWMDAWRAGRIRYIRYDSGIWQPNAI